MKVDFADKFDDNKVEKWKSHYIDYVRLRASLGRLKDAAHQGGAAAPRPAAGLASSVGPGPGPGVSPGASQASEGDPGGDNKRLTWETKSLVCGSGGRGAYGSADAGDGSDRPASGQHSPEHERRLNELAERFKSELLGEVRHACVRGFR